MRPVRFTQTALSFAVVQIVPMRPAREMGTRFLTLTHTAPGSSGPRYCWSGLSYWCLTVHITNGPSDGMADSSGIRRDSSLAHRPHTPFVIIWFWCNYSDSRGGGLTVWISLNVGRGVAMSIPSACSTDRYDGYISLRSHCTSLSASCSQHLTYPSIYSSCPKSC